MVYAGGHGTGPWGDKVRAALEAEGIDVLRPPIRPESGPVLGAWAAGLPPGVLLFLDPGPLVADIHAAVLDPVLSRCDWYSCNQREAGLLAGVADPVEAAHRLARQTGRAGVIVRAGPGGWPASRAGFRPTP